MGAPSCNRKAKAPQQKQMSDAKGAGHEQVNHNRRRGEA
jgi:hypothetical protein